MDCIDRAVTWPVRLLLFLLVVCQAAAAADVSEDIEIPEDMLFQPGVFTSSEVCGKCHQDIYKAWNGRSIHAQAMVDPDFQNALADVKREERVACMRCHAPTTVVTEDYAGATSLTHEGVTCDFCHSVKGVDLNRTQPYELDVGLTKRGPLRNPGTPPHKAVYSELHTKSLFCAGCHEYTNRHGVAVLTNYSEWLEGPYPKRQVACQGCHMEIYQAKLAAGQDTDEVSRIFINLHEVPGGNSPSQLRRAFYMEIEEARTAGGELRVVVAVSNLVAGHKIPGGLATHRARLEVTVWDGVKENRQERVYERVLTDASGRPIREVARLFTDATAVRSDNRIAPGEVRKERFIFPPAKRGAGVEARLIYVVEPPWPGAEKREVDIMRASAEVK